MIRANIVGKWLLAGGLVLGLGPVVRADHDERRRPKVDVDLDTLKAEIERVEGGWELEIEYEVEIEDARPGQQFELVLELRQRDRPVLDERGGPFTIVVALDCPSDLDDDKVVFAEEFVELLHPDMVRRPDKLRLYGTVYFKGDDWPLDEKNTSVKLRD